MNSNDYNIGEIYQQMELHLIESMKRNLSRHVKEENKEGFKWEQWQALKLKELKRYQRQNVDIIGYYSDLIDNVTKKQLKDQFREGSKASQKEFKEALKNGYKYDKKLNKSFFGINDRKVNNLIQSVNNDLKIAERATLRMINDEYRQVIHKAVMFAGNGVMTEKQAIDMATKDFLSRGLNSIEYSNGRRVNISSYSKMAVRTANQRAYLQGEGEFRKKIGNSLIKISKHGTSCKLCQVWEGKVLIDDVYSGGTKKDGKYPLLSEAMKQGLYHPNCRHGLGTYYPELEDIEKSYDDGQDGSKSDEEYQNNLNYCNLMIQKFKRLEMGSLDDNNIQFYKQRRTLYEKKRESIIKKSNSNVYVDNTKLYLTNATPNSHEITFDNYFIDDDGIKHPVKGKEFVHPIPTSGEEFEMAKFLKKTFGGDIHLVPRITDISNESRKVKTPDFRWNGKKWDLKTPGTEGLFENTLERFLKKKDAKQQAKKFIINYTNFPNKNSEDIIHVVMNTLQQPSRQWVEDIIIVHNDKVIKVISKQVK